VPYYSYKCKLARMEQHFILITMKFIIRYSVLERRLIINNTNSNMLSIF